MIVNDIIGAVMSGVEITISLLQLAFFNFLIKGGWVTLLRAIGFFIDKTLISLMTKAFEYFELIISKELFAPKLIDTITDNVYFFIAIFILFKLALRFIKYIMDPNLVSDDNIGTNAILKRTIVGLSLIIFIPSIFGVIRDFQKAIIADDVINKIIMDKNTEVKYNEIKQKAPTGRIIGFSILQGFLDFDDSKFLSSTSKKDWNTAVNTFDPSPISINDGGLGYINNYFYDYIPIISTVALGYALWLVIKYCFDVLVRFFKLTILQIISPIVMVDYIFEGAQGSFKQWTTTVIATFTMLFIRILSLSFVIMVAIHMQMSQQDCIKNYVNSADTEKVQTDNRIACENSLLYTDKDGDVDNLLRAGIIIALLAFSMDLPKIIGGIFNLDLEQESSVTAMVQKAGGALKMVGLGGLAFGGGLLGGAIGGLRGSAHALGERSAARKENQGLRNRANSEHEAGMKKLNESGLRKNSNEYKRQKEALDNRRDAKLRQADALDRKANRTAVSKINKSTGAMAFGGLKAAAGSMGLGSVVGAYSSTKQEGSNGADYIDTNAAELAEATAAANNADAEVSRNEAYNDKQKALKIDKERNILAEAQVTELRNINTKLGVNKKIDSTEVVSQAEALEDSGDYNASDSILGNLQSANETLTETKTISKDIQKNVDLIQESTFNTAINVDNVVKKVNNIEENTQITAVDSINNMENSGYIDKPLSSSSDKLQSKSPTNIGDNDTETL